MPGGGTQPKEAGRQADCEQPPEWFATYMDKVRLALPPLCLKPNLFVKVIFTFTSKGSKEKRLLFVVCSMCIHRRKRLSHHQNCLASPFVLCVISEAVLATSPDTTGSAQFFSSIGVYTSFGV